MPEDVLDEMNELFAGMDDTDVKPKAKRKRKPKAEKPKEITPLDVPEIRHEKEFGKGTEGDDKPVFAEPSASVREVEMKPEDVQTTPEDVDPETGEIRGGFPEPVRQIFVPFRRDLGADLDAMSTIKGVAIENYEKFDKKNPYMAKHHPVVTIRIAELKFVREVTFHSENDEPALPEMEG